MCPRHHGRTSQIEPGNSPRKNEMECWRGIGWESGIRTRLVTEALTQQGGDQTKPVLRAGSLSPRDRAAPSQRQVNKSASLGDVSALPRRVPPLPLAPDRVCVLTRRSCIDARSATFKIRRSSIRSVCRVSSMTSASRNADSRRLAAWRRFALFASPRPLSAPTT
jgi:hypothetical protein